LLFNSNERVEKSLIDQINIAKNSRSSIVCSGGN